MLYAAKCYWPGVTETELEQVAARAPLAGSSPGRDGVTYADRRSHPQSRPVSNR